MTPRSSVNHQDQRVRSSVGLISQSQPYEMAPSNDGQNSPMLPRNDSNCFGDAVRCRSSLVKGNKVRQPVDFYKIVKARQNLLYIEKENLKAQIGNGDLK